MLEVTEMKRSYTPSVCPRCGEALRRGEELDSRRTFDAAGLLRGVSDEERRAACGGWGVDAEAGSGRSSASADEPLRAMNTLRSRISLSFGGGLFSSLSSSLRN